MEPKSKLPLIFIVCGIPVILIAGLMLFGRIAEKRHSDEIKPYITFSRLMYLASPGCEDYRKQYGAWPISLTQLLGFRADVGENSVDMWGRDFVLVPYNESLGYGQIISYGRDGKLGGAGADYDIEIRFPAEGNAGWNEAAGRGLRRPTRVP